MRDWFDRQTRAEIRIWIWRLWAACAGAAPLIALAGAAVGHPTVTGVGLLLSLLYTGPFLTVLAAGSVVSFFRVLAGSR